MNVKELSHLVDEKKNFLCVGLDPDLAKLPKHLKQNADGIVSFNQAIIEATAEHCVAYKLNFAFFEALGKEGWRALEQTRKLLPESHFLIADAKRGDIGNTARKYAESIFGELNFDAVTLNPYMGRDVISPFLEYEDKTIILLALTSNAGSLDFQMSLLENGMHVFEEVIQKSSTWTEDDRLMYVVGATKPAYFKNIRKYAPNHFLLVPGVGAQGGSLDLVYEYGRSRNLGLLVNSSRAIIFADDSENFATASAKAAREMHENMRHLISSD